MKKMIKYNWFFEQSPEMVWNYLTTSELMAQWLMNNDFELVPGHEFMFKSGPQPSMDFDGNVYCKILEIDPLKKLVYSWKIRQGERKLMMDSVVTWFLIPKKGGTELILEHTGLDSWSEIMFQAMNKGWDQNVKVKMGNLFNINPHNETTGN